MWTADWPPGHWSVTGQYGSDGTASMEVVTLPVWTWPDCERLATTATPGKAELGQELVSNLASHFPLDNGSNLAASSINRLITLVFLSHSL